MGKTVKSPYAPKSSPSEVYLNPKFDPMLPKLERQSESLLQIGKLPGFFDLAVPCFLSSPTRPVRPGKKSYEEMMELCKPQPVRALPPAGIPIMDLEGNTCCTIQPLTRRTRK